MNFSFNPTYQLSHRCNCDLDGNTIWKLSINVHNKTSKEYLTNYNTFIHIVLKQSLQSALTKSKKETRDVSLIKSQTIHQSYCHLFPYINVVWLCVWKVNRAQIIAQKLWTVPTWFQPARTGNKSQRNNPTMPNPLMTTRPSWEIPSAGVCFKSSFWKMAVVILRPLSLSLSLSLSVGSQVSGAVSL